MIFFRGTSKAFCNKFAQVLMLSFHSNWKKEHVPIEEINWKKLHVLCELYFWWFLEPPQIRIKNVFLYVSMYPSQGYLRATVLHTTGRQQLLLNRMMREKQCLSSTVFLPSYPRPIPSASGRYNSTKRNRTERARDPPWQNLCVATKACINTRGEPRITSYGR